MSIITSLLSAATICLTFIVWSGAGALNAALFCMAFFVATGIGKSVPYILGPNAQYRLPILAVTALAGALAYWLGQHGSVTFHYGSGFNLQGEWWALLAGPIAGFALKNEA
jgi:hypothetical protein